MSKVQGESVMGNKLTKEQLNILIQDLYNSTLFKPHRRGWEHISEEEQMKLRKKNEDIHKKQRFECMGTKDDKSDRCDLYDSEGYCRYYGDTWKGDDGVFRGGMDVECITYCTKRTINGKHINDDMNPLYMERLPRWNKFLNEHGVFEHSYCRFYNEEGRNPP